MKNHSLTPSLPSPMPILFSLLGLAVLAWVTTESPLVPIVLAGAIFMAVLSVILSRDLDTALVVLIAAAVMPRLSLNIGGLNARPEHIAAAAILLIVLFRFRHGVAKTQWDLPDYLVAAYLVLNVFSSLFMSIAPGQTTKWALQQALAILPYFLLRILVNNQARFDRTIASFVSINVATAAFGVFCFCSYMWFGTNFGVDPTQYGEIPGTHGTLYEANFLGAFCGSAFILTMVFYFKAPSKKRLFGVLVTASGLLVSLSRAALGATLVATVAFLLCSWRFNFLDNRIARRVMLNVALLMFVLASVLLPFYIERFSSLAAEGVNDPEIASRFIAVSLALNNIATHPLLGNGTSSFQLFFSSSDMGLTDDGVGTWVGNVEARILHDTGIAGLCVFAAILWTLLVRSIRSLKRNFTPELLALLLSASVYCITFQATEGTLLAFPWVHLGLIASSLSIVRESQTGPSVAASE